MNRQSFRERQSSLLDLIFPPQCLLCGALVQGAGGLCGACWRDTPFLLGLGCDLCGAPLIGEDPGSPVHCDDCRAAQRPWARGRAVMLYDGGARRLVLGLKHGDRLDLVPSLARWMAARAAPLITPETLVVPVPVHWRRLLARRYNQAAVLARALARELAVPDCPDLLTRTRRTQPHEGMGPEARFANVADAFRVTARHRSRLAGRRVLLIDDVMTSGATLSECAAACLAAGATQVEVVVLARAVRGS